MPSALPKTVRIEPGRTALTCDRLFPWQNLSDHVSAPDGLRARPRSLAAVGRVVSRYGGRIETRLRSTGRAGPRHGTSLTPSRPAVPAVCLDRRGSPPFVVFRDSSGLLRLGASRRRRSLPRAAQVGTRCDHVRGGPVEAGGDDCLGEEVTRSVRSSRTGPATASDACGNPVASGSRAIRPRRPCPPIACGSPPACTWQG